ncbi:MAG: hypothetical protein FWF47_00510 [Clostridia bacterium]|nr:hypothetical protein [Clostridia bacterium]
MNKRVIWLFAAMILLVFICIGTHAQEPIITDTGDEQTADSIDIDTGTAADYSFIDRIFVCVAVEVGDMPVDPSILGRYDVIFRTDGTASFTIAGFNMDGCTWRDDGNIITLDFYTTLYEYVRIGEGLQMNYFDTMLLTYMAEDAEYNPPVPTPESEIIPPILCDTEREVIEHGLFSVSYPDNWIYDEGRSSMNDKSANIRFTFYDDAGKEQYRINISASPDSAKQHRRGFTDNGFSLKDLADGKLTGMVVDGTVFYESKPGEVYRYRHDPSGVNYYIQFFPAKGVDLLAAPFTDIINGVRLHLTDEGTAATPWPWDGMPWTPDINPQTAGSITLTPMFLKADEPIILNRTMGTSMTVSNDLIYTVTKNELSAYRINDDTVVFENAVKLDEEYEMIRTDKTGRLYLSQGIWSVFVYDGFNKISAPSIKHDLVMHPSGEWGISFWVNADPQIITVKDNVYEAAPWVLTDLTKPETRTGYFKMISDIRISDSHIMVAGSAADDSGEKIMVYDFDGNELFALGNTRADRSGLGHITGITETPNGFLATDGNMRSIILWDINGAFVGTIDVKKLLGAGYCWLEDMHLMDDGTILIAISQERADKSADELLFFKLTGF